MSNFETLVNKIADLRATSTISAEAWDRLILSGDFSDTGSLRELVLTLEQMNITSNWTLMFDDDQPVDGIQKFEAELELSPMSWKLVLWTHRIINLPSIRDQKSCQALFFSQANFQRWFDSLGEFGNVPEGFIYNDLPIKIFVHGIVTSFGGPRFAVLPINTAPPAHWPLDRFAPSMEDIKTHVYFVTQSELDIDPEFFVVNWGDTSSELATMFKRLSVIKIAACFASEIYSTDKVIVKGVKKHTLTLNSSDIDLTSYDSVLEALKWCFAERTETRRLLFVDRLTLDIDESESLVSNLASYVKTALDEAKTKYEFVIRDRKDEHAKELSALHKDIREHTKLHAEKIRSLTSSMLRDALATILVAGVGLVARLLRAPEAVDSPAIKYLFVALAFYLAISLIIQVATHVYDLHLSNKEFHNWVKVTRNHMSQKEVKDTIDKDVKPRVCFFHIQLSVAVVLYIALIIVSSNMPSIIKSFSAVAA